MTDVKNVFTIAEDILNKLPDLGMKIGDFTIQVDPENKTEVAVTVQRAGDDIEDLYGVYRSVEAAVVDLIVNHPDMFVKHERAEQFPVFEDHPSAVIPSEDGHSAVYVYKGEMV